MRYYASMDWTKLIADIRSRGVTLQIIKDECGFASRGHVHDVAGGRQTKLEWRIGDSLIRLHRRVMRRKRSVN